MYVFKLTPTLLNHIFDLKPINLDVTIFSVYNESRWCCSFRKVTCISIALYTIQIVPKQLHSNKRNQL